MSKAPLGSRSNPIVIDDTPPRYDRSNHPFRLGSRINPIVIEDDYPHEWLDQLHEFIPCIRSPSIDSVSTIEDIHPVYRDRSPVLAVRRNSPLRGEPTVMNPNLALTQEPPVPVLFQQPAPYGILWGRVTIFIEFGHQVYEYSYLTCIPEP